MPVSSVPPISSAPTDVSLETTARVQGYALVVALDRAGRAYRIDYADPALLQRLGRTSRELLDQLGRLRTDAPGTLTLTDELGSTHAFTVAAMPLVPAGDHDARRLITLTGIAAAGLPQTARRQGGLEAGIGPAYRTLLETSPHGIVEVDLTGTVLAASPSLQRLLGTPGALEGRRFWELWHGDPTGARLQRRFRRLLQRRPKPTPCQQLKPPGTVGDDRSLRIDWNYLYDGEGRLAGLMAVVSEVALQQSPEAALRDGQEWLMAFVTASSDWFWSTDRDDRFTLICGQYQRVCGIAEHLLIGRPRLELLRRYAADPEPQGWQDHLADWQSRRPFRDFRYTWRRPDGGERIISVSAIPLFDSEGRFQGYRGTGTDVTAEVRAAAEAKSAHNRLVEAIESVGDSFALFDRDDRLVLCNRAYREFLHPPFEVHEGDTFTALLWAAVKGGVFPEANDDPEGFVARRLARHRHLPSEHEHRRHGGRWIKIREIATHDGGTLIWITDITAAKQREQALRQAKEEAERANRAKSKFLAAASHDLRQPLHAASLFQQLLANRLPDEPSRGLAGKLRDALTATEELLNKLLDISKLDAGMVRAERRVFTLRELLQRCAQEHGVQAESKGLALRVVPSSLRTHSDPVLLEGMLRNLVANAIRYAARGKVLIGCRRCGDKVMLEVWDNGPGIPAGEAEAIFEDFYQINRSDRDRQSGLGLGLGIVRRLGHLLGHRVGVRSAEGGGSVFWIELPIAEGSGGELHRSPSVPERGRALAGTTIVLVEDDAVQLEGLKLLFEDWGCTVIAARTVAEAVAGIRSRDTRPDCAIADFRLRQGGTGIHAMETLAAELGRSLPGVILTGDLEARRVKQAAAAGFRLLHKPVEPRLLYRTVCDLLAVTVGPD